MASGHPPEGHVNFQALQDPCLFVCLFVYLFVYLFIYLCAKKNNVENSLRHTVYNVLFQTKSAALHNRLFLSFMFNTQFVCFFQFSSVTERIYIWLKCTMPYRLTAIFSLIYSIKSCLWKQLLELHKVSCTMKLDITGRSRYRYQSREIIRHRSSDFLCRAFSSSQEKCPRRKL